MHYPRSTGEFQSRFPTDADCLDYLAWLRWPEGFVCPRCENPSGWFVAGGSFKCAGCHRQTAVTAGTLFDRRRTPLTVWFAVCWQFAAAKDVVSARSLQRTAQGCHRLALDFTSEAHGRVKQIRAQIEEATSDYDKEKMQERASSRAAWP